MRDQKSMLDYCKLVLQSVRFDKKLFRKEYRKALRWLSPLEAITLKFWLRNNIRST